MQSDYKWKYHEIKVTYLEKETVFYSSWNSEVVWTKEAVRISRKQICHYITYIIVVFQKASELEQVQQTHNGKWVIIIVRSSPNL